MDRFAGRKLLWAYALLMLLAAIGYARFDSYMMDGDGTAFLDIAQDLRTGHASLAINGYWNPGYPAVLASAESLVKPSLWHELVVVRYVNILIFALAMLASVFFTTGLTRARALHEGADGTAVPAGALHLLGLALLTLSMGRELPIAAPRADTLLLAFLLFAMGLLLRLHTGAGLWAFPVLGLTLGCAYLTKSFAFLPSVALIVALFIYGLTAGPTRRGAQRSRMFGGTFLLAAAFALTAGPYIRAISHQLGHLTTGDSARLNYAFFIDGTARWHEWFHGTLGHASGPFTHPELPLATAPPVYSYAAHPQGTFPLWFDPAWWTAGLKPHIWLPGHIARLARNCVVFVRFLLGRPEPFVLLAVLLVFGAAWPPISQQIFHLRRHPSTSLWALAPIAWGLLMLGIYFPIDLQDRYLTGPFLLVLLPVFALLRAPATTAVKAGPAANAVTANAALPTIASALIALFAFLNLSQAATYLAERRRHIPPAEQQHPGYDDRIFPAAAALDQLGLQPGDKIACVGDVACFTDHYWARLAGTQILAEVETPGEADPLAVWNHIADKGTVTAPLAAHGLRYLVTLFPNSTAKPTGWIQLGHTDFFAYPLQEPVSAENAAGIVNFQPTP